MHSIVSARYLPPSIFDLYGGTDLEVQVHEPPALLSLCDDAQLSRWPEFVGFAHVPAVNNGAGRYLHESALEWPLNSP